MRKSFLSSLAVLMASFFVLSCSKDDNSSLKEVEKRNEIIQEETPKENQKNNASENNAGTENNNEIQNKRLFVYKALVEDFTGTWCPVCPIASRTIERTQSIDKYKERFVPVAIHLSTSGYNGNDKMQINQSYPLFNYFRNVFSKGKEIGLPYLMLNRKTELSHFDQGRVTIIENIHSKETSPIGIKIASDLKESNGTVTVTFKSSQEFDALKYHVFITEDNIIARQNDSGRYVDNFVHNHVLRCVYGDLEGNNLGSVNKDGEVTKENLQVNYSLLSAGKLSNVKVVVFVSDATTGEVLNVQEAKANETKDYQYVQ
ncbi:MAG: Omp28-related outer membrane protein [Capnocytophaga felis]|nr:Omp28-related outer membrane protein [Capnocytophaga felis]